MTFGQVPGTSGVTTARYDETIRWTGILQARLGQTAQIIEEGLPSRTIGLEDPRPGKNGRNGSTYLLPCIESQLPIDVLIIWLGTNNTKELFNQTAEQITTAMDKLLTAAHQFLSERHTKTHIILVAPPKIDEKNPIVRQWYAKAAPKLNELARLYKSLAERRRIEFIDLYSVLSKPDPRDGLHLTPEQNHQVADIMFEKLQRIGVIS